MSDQEGGTLTTRPFIFLDDDIQVNADASDGSVRVEILDGKGQPIDGFTAADCQVLHGDQLRHTLSWKEKQYCAQLKGHTVRLRFYLDRAKLFSFTPVAHRDP